MNKIIAISLWGNNPRYSIGAIKNAELAKQYFPDWRVRIYYRSDVLEEHLNILKTFDNVDLLDYTDNSIAPCFWRFYSLFESPENVVLLRDSDSRLSQREKLCVDSWLISDKKYLIIRDHIRHYDFPILAGMWGYTGKMSSRYLEEMLKYGNKDFYTIDQIYLKEVVWLEASFNSLIFGIIENEEFLDSRDSILPHFVGQGYDENETPIYPIE